MDVMAALERRSRRADARRRCLRHLVFPATAVVLLGGCGEDEDAQQQARLVVRESLPPTPRYVEGSVSFLRVEKTGSGEVIIDGPVTDGQQVRGREPLFSRAVEPGEYRLVSYQRPCQGTCEQLDPPTDRCEATVGLDAGETLTATVVLSQDGGCTVREA